MKKYPRTIRRGSVKVRIYRTKSTRLAAGIIFQVAWHDGTGRRLKQFADAEDADLYAQQIATDLQNGRTELSMNAQEADLLTEAKRLCDGVPLLEALREWRKATDLSRGQLIEACRLYAEVETSRIEGVPLADAVTKFLKAKQVQGVDVVSSYKNRLALFADAFPNMAVRSINTPMIDKYLARFENPATRNTHRRNIVTLFTWCRKQGYLPNTQRTAADDSMRAQETPDTAIGIITPDTASKLLRLIQSEHSHYLAPLTLALFCGLRRAEVHAQTWESIDLAASTLHVDKAKPRTPADRLVEIPPCAVQWLMRCSDRKGALCSNLSLDRVRDIGRTAGLDLPDNCFRHSAITFKMATGMSAGQVAGWAGTSERQIHKHYRRPRPRTEGEQWFALYPDAVLSATDNIVQMGGNHA